MHTTDSRARLAYEMTAASRRADILRRGAFVLCHLLLALVVAGPASAQSGRRVTKQTIEPVTEGTPQPTPTPKPTPPKIPVTVVSGEPSSMRTPLGSTELVGQAVVRRLRDTNALDAKGGERRVRRNDARRLAQSGESFVVWFEVEIDMLSDRGGVGRARAEELRVQYVVFEAKTGREQAQGSVWLRPEGSFGRVGGVRVGRGGVPDCYPAGLGADYSLIEAGIAVGNRVIKSFGLLEPPHCGGP